MANHAYVVPKECPTKAEVAETVQKFLDERFPQLYLNECEDGFIVMVRREIDGDSVFAQSFCLSFWMGTYRKKPCIEFRHGHGLEILWWIEHEIRYYLAVKYDAVQYDDADSRKVTVKDDQSYRTYLEYLDKTGLRLWKLESAHREKGLLPSALAQLYGDIPIVHT